MQEVDLEVVAVLVLEMVAQLVGSLKDQPRNDLSLWETDYEGKITYKRWQLNIHIVEEQRVDVSSKGRLAPTLSVRGRQVRHAQHRLKCHLDLYNLSKKMNLAS